MCGNLTPGVQLQPSLIKRAQRPILDVGCNGLVPQHVLRRIGLRRRARLIGFRNKDSPVRSFVCFERLQLLPVAIEVIVDRSRQAIA